MARIAALIIMDGLGIREKQDYNAVVQAVTPNYDFYMKNHERSILDASGEAVGLVDGQMGNSEVGHLNLGAGFVVAQDIRRIDIAIEDGSFFNIKGHLVHSFVIVVILHYIVKRKNVIHKGGV